MDNSEALQLLEELDQIRVKAGMPRMDENSRRDFLKKMGAGAAGLGAAAVGLGGAAAGAGSAMRSDTGREMAAMAGVATMEAQDFYETKFEIRLAIKTVDQIINFLNNKGMEIAADNLKGGVSKRLKEAYRMLEKGHM